MAASFFFSNKSIKPERRRGSPPPDDRCRCQHPAVRNLCHCVRLPSACFAATSTAAKKLPQNALFSRRRIPVSRHQPPPAATRFAHTTQRFVSPRTGTCDDRPLRRSDSYEMLSFFRAMGRIFRCSGASVPPHLSCVELDLPSKIVLILIFLFSSALPPNAFGCCCSDRAAEETPTGPCPRCIAASRAADDDRPSCCRTNQQPFQQTCGHRCLCRPFEHSPAQRPETATPLAGHAMFQQVRPDPVIQTSRFDRGSVEREFAVSECRQKLCVWLI